MAREFNYVLEEIVRVSKDLDIDPRMLSKAQFLKNTDVTNHDLFTYGGLMKLRNDAASTYNIVPKQDLKKVRGVESRNNYVRSLERAISTGDYLSDKLLSGMEDIFTKRAIKLPKKSVKVNKVDNTKRLLTLLWSDLHFGLDVDPREVLNSSFTWRIAARRMAKCCLQAATWKPYHRDETELQVVLNGDILAGVIHLSEANIKEIQEQIWGATAILAHSLNFLRNHFAKINVLCLPGNHDRITYRSKERAVSQRWNSHAHSVFMGLKIWFRQDTDVTFDIPMSGMGHYTTPGDHIILATHGDVEPMTSNVGKRFDVEKTTKSILKMNSGNVLHKKIDVVLFGHWHQPSVFMMPDGTTCVVNGCFVEGTKVISPYGTKNIEDINVGDYVLSRDGTTQIVENITSLNSDSTIVLRAKGLPNFLECTSNHEFWAIKGETGDARRVKRGLNKTNDLSHREKRGSHSASVVINERPRWISAENLSYGDWIHTPSLKGTDTADKDWLWTLGSTLYREEFGIGAHNKRVPKWMFSLSAECREAVVQGWIDGDGHTTKTGQTSATTVSEELAWGMYFMSIGTNLEPMMYRYSRGKSNVWTIRFTKGQDVKWVDGERFIRLDYRGRKNDPRKVYDLQVSGEHTYVVEGFGVHNSLIGTDPYAQNVCGFFNSVPAQVMFESVANYPVGDFRVIQLKDADNDESLDDIINVPGLEQGGLIDF